MLKYTCIHISYGILVYFIVLYRVEIHGLLLAVVVPDTASYIRGWIQMVLAPNDLFSWNNKYNKYNEYTSLTHALLSSQLCTLTHSVHAGILKPWRGRLPCPLVVFSSCHVSRLLSSLVRAQLTLLVPALGIRSPLPQNGAPIHRVRAHFLTGIRNSCILVYCVY